MIRYIVKCNKPEILVITPLLTGHSISKDCKNSIKKTKTPFEWISYKGEGNPCKNSQLALDEYRKNHKLPKYIIKIDNDILASNGMLDVMRITLDNAPHSVSYCYCSFGFRGAMKLNFVADKFHEPRLLAHNYISSCSLMRTDRFLEVGEWVTDDKGFRLLDWALWLKFLQHGYIGIPTRSTSFLATASESSVSNRGNQDYYEKRKWVLENFT